MRISDDTQLVIGFAFLLFMLCAGIALIIWAKGAWT